MLAAYRKKNKEKKTKVFQKRELNLKPKCSVYSDFSTRIHAKAGIMAAELGFTTNVYLEEGDFRGDHLIFRRTKGGSVVTENPKGGIAENFGRIQRGDHSNLFVK